MSQIQLKQQINEPRTTFNQRCADTLQTSAASTMLTDTHYQCLMHLICLVLGWDKCDVVTCSACMYTGYINK